ncbi:MAG: 30S ribosomal protein S16, partial [Candidatus Eremiobacterota bacterium]
KEEKALYWLSCGAQPTETVRSLLRQKGIWDKFQEMGKEKKEV